MNRVLRGGGKSPVTVEAEVTHIYGATLGNDWAGFPLIATRDYDNSEMLLVELPIYLDWELQFNGCPSPSQVPDPTPIDPPRPLADEAWFVGHHAQLELTDAPWSDVDNVDYTACPFNVGIEEPAVAPLDHVYPVNADGTLRIRDMHGGTATDHVFILRYVVGTETHIVLFRWSRPQSYVNIATQLPIDAIPGSKVPRPREVTVQRFNGDTCGTYTAWSTLLVVEHVSADLSSASRRYIDAGDVGAFAQHYGHAVKWGHDSDGGPAERNFHANLAPFDNSALAIDSADLAKLAQELDTSCNISKSQVGERAAILEWFGAVPTGHDVETGPNGETSPEYVFGDPSRLARAIADPYGYRTAARAVSIPWGRVKELFR
jgi:hypothetical protein